ncbi:MAG: hypothetical protein ABI673_07785 [Novosphingobium sp.]
MKAEVHAGLGGCLQITRILARLRGRKWRIPVMRDNIPKVGGRGTYGRYYLGPEVKVWEPGAAEEVGEAGR